MNKKSIETIIRSHIEVSKDLLNISDKILVLSEKVYNVFSSGGKIFLFGNGGSAADCQHIAAELSGKFYNSKRPGLPAISLTTNTSSLTAIGNDFDYSDIFSRQLEGMAGPDDLVIGISTSGQSSNVFNAFKKAKELGTYTVLLTGLSESDSSRFCNQSIHVPSDDTPRIQEQHILIGHIMCELVESKLFID